MKRARLIVKEIEIKKRGEVQYFQIRIPKNATRIIGIETDLILLAAIELGLSRADEGLPFLNARHNSNPVVGKLKLQSTDRSNVFFETWLRCVYLNSAMPDMVKGLFPVNPHSLLTNGKPRKVEVACHNRVINGVFHDIAHNRGGDRNYRIKIFLWLETTEETKGVIYDLQTENTKPSDTKP